jgi:hypothetical protein
MIGFAGPISVLQSSNVPGYVPPAPTAPVAVPSSPTVPVVVPSVPTVPASVPLASTPPVYPPPVSTPFVYVPGVSTPSVYVPPISTPSVYVPPASAIPVAPSSTVSHWELPAPTVNCTLQACNSRLWNETGPDILDVRLTISPPERLLVESSPGFRHSPRQKPNHELLFPSSH